MKRAVLYGRISKDRANETSTETQVKEMTQWCELHGYEPVATFIDVGKSAFKLDVDRDEFEKAMSLIENGHADTLVVWKLDRMMRNARQWVKENERLEKAGATFASVKEPWFDTSTPIGFALVVLMAALAEMEAEGIQARAVGWHKGRLSRGDVPGGNRPYGYTRGTNTLTIDPDEAAIIEWLAANIMAGKSLRSLARELDDKEIPTSQGDSWSHTTIRSIMMGGTVAAKRKLKDGTFKDSKKWEPILDDDTWNRVRTILSDPSRSCVENSKHSRKLKYLLPGLLTCGKCGDKLRSKGHTAGMRYQCLSCGLGISQPMADDFVGAVLLELLDDEAWASLRAQGRKSNPAQLERLNAQLNHERGKWLDGLLTDQEWDDTQTQIKDRAAKLEQAEAVEIPDVESVKEAWPDMNVHDKRLVITAVTKAITVKPYVKGATGTERIVIDMA